MRTSILLPLFLSSLTNPFLIIATSTINPLISASSLMTNNGPTLISSVLSTTVVLTHSPAELAGGCNQLTRQMCCPGVPFVPDLGDGLGNHTFAEACKDASSEIFGSDWAKKCDWQWDYDCCQGSTTCNFVPGTGFPFIPSDRCKNVTEILTNTSCQALKTSGIVSGESAPPCTTILPPYTHTVSWLSATITLAPAARPSGTHANSIPATVLPAPTSTVFEQNPTMAGEPIESLNTSRNLKKIDPNSWTELIGPANFDFIAQLFKTSVQGIIYKEVLWRFTECSNQVIQIFVEDCILWDSGLLCEWGWKNFNTSRTGSFWKGD